MNSMKDLLAKFDTVEVKNVNLIAEADKLFCEKNQAAYEAAVTSYEELHFYWEDNLFAEMPHFHVWLRLITRERDYNLYCHYYYKEPPGEDR